MTDQRLPRMTLIVAQNVEASGAPPAQIGLALQADLLMQMTLDPTTYNDVPDAVKHLADRHPDELGVVTLYLLQALKNFEGVLANGYEIAHKIDPGTYQAVADEVRRIL